MRFGTRYRCRGKGPVFYKFGERVRYTPDDLGQWAATRPPRPKGSSHQACISRGTTRTEAGAAVREDRYKPGARVLHWLMAAGFIFMWACGYAMTTWVAEDSALEELLFDLHVSS